MILQDREKVFLETLARIAEFDLVLIGGYAVNAYVPPRYSVDCDLVVLGDLEKAEVIIVKEGFVRARDAGQPTGDYAHYIKEKEKVAVDLLIGRVLDRLTNISFEGELFEKYSRKRRVLGRATTSGIEMRVADPELLFSMNFVSGRKQDIRDIFMLSGTDLDWKTVKEIISAKCDKNLLKKRIKLVRDSVSSDSYRKSLEGAFGGVPNERFDACKGKLFKFLDEFR